MKRILFVIVVCFIQFSVPTCLIAQVGIERFSEEIQNTLSKNKFKDNQLEKFLKKASRQMPEIKEADMRVPIYSVFIKKCYAHKGKNNTDSLFCYLNTQKTYLSFVLLSYKGNDLIFERKYKNRQEQAVISGERVKRLVSIIREKQADYILTIDEDINSLIIIKDTTLYFYNYDIQKGYALCSPTEYVKHFDGTMIYMNHRPDPLYYSR